MRRPVFRFVRLLLVMLVIPCAPMPASAGDDARAAAAPSGAPLRKWRIGYYEGGQDPAYGGILRATVRGLAELGWMKPVELPSGNDPGGGALWAVLASKSAGGRIEFVRDGYYSAGNFDAGQRQETRSALKKRLQERHDIDLMLGMGAWAGEDLPDVAPGVPAVLLSTSDPVPSGGARERVDEAERSPARSQGRYTRQLAIFRDATHFQRLGIVYEESRQGRIDAAVATIEALAATGKFQVVRCLAQFRGVAAKEAERQVASCYRDVARRADAVYVTPHPAISKAVLKEIVGILTAAGTPSFSMAGSDEVRRGVLMSVSQGDDAGAGAYHAKTIGRILNGAHAPSLRQAWLVPEKIALNIRTAELIGYDPPMELLVAADDLFTTISDGK